MNLAFRIALLFIFCALLGFSQETFTAQNNGGLDLWTDHNDWDADVGTDRDPDCNAGSVVIDIPSGVTIVYRNFPGDVNQLTCPVALEVYGTLSIRNNDNDSTGLWFSNAASTMFIDDGATLDTQTPGGGNPNKNFIKLQNEMIWNGQTNGDYTEDEPGGFTYTGTIPLPIDLLYFKAIPQDKKAKLVWSTIAEINNDYFTIYRSSDGKHFEVIGEIEGAGSSSSTQVYSYTDENPLHGLSYYKLRQTDFNGRYEEFPVVVFANEEVKSNSVSIHPNPANGMVTLTGNDQLFQTTVVNAQGKVVLASNKLSLAATQNFINKYIDRMDRGVYFIKLKGEYDFSVIRLVLE